MISFLIVNWNGGQVFKECILAIRENMGGRTEKYETIVVDNASKDLDRDFLSSQEVRLIENRKNLYFAIATNQTVEASQGDVLFVMNNDIVLPPSSVGPLLSLHEKHKDEVVCTTLVNNDGSIQPSVRNLPTPMSVLYALLGLDRLHSRFDQWFLHGFDYGRSCYVEQPMFAFLVMHRRIWEKVGEMDRRFPLLFNDVDWFFRASKDGILTYYSSDVRVRHVHGYSVNRKRYRKVLLSTVGMYRYFAKNISSNVLYHIWAIFVCGLSFYARIAFETLQIL